MNTRTLFTLLLTMMSGAAIAVDKVQFMTLDEAQQASSKSAEEVRAADINGDRLIDTVEFAALTVAPGDAPADATERSGAPARE